MRHTILALPLASLVALAACGSSGSPGNGNGTGTTAAKVSQGVVTARSTSAITVNGQNFATSASTTVTVDDSPKSASDLQPGMVVRVKVDDHGNATSIDSKSEVRGAVDDNSSTTITVGGQPVRIDDSTQFDDSRRQGGVPRGTQVRVHGFPDDKGGLRATRIDHDSSNDFEIHGIASGLSSTGFTLTVSKVAGAPTFTVQYGTGVSAPAGLAEGSFVEVKSLTQPTNGVIVASAVKLDDNSLGSQGEAEIEGFVTSGTSASFVVDGHTITTTSATKWVGGAPADLLPGVKVEAEGQLDSSGNLAATKVSFRDGYRLQGSASGAPTSGTSGTFTVLGRTIQVTDATELEDGLTLGTIGTQNVQVRGYPAADGRGLVALRVKLGTGGGGGGGSTRSFVQAPVTSVTGQTIVMFGFTVDGSTASLQTRDGVPATDRAAFFAQLTPGTVVKARAAGAVANDAFTADEIELEDDK
jgi:hypothetical protein